ncbi:hypothetical protein BDV18DRAFT_129490 [Aspergillus unguis]
MSSNTREGSRDRELVLSRHQTVPMWDSSDPERAPPPLPMNPGSTSPVTKGNVSPNIQAVAANFTEKARENSPTSPYTTNPMTPKSPEKSLIRGQFHKRMQSLQNTDTRSEFLNYLENKSPERPLRASFSDQSSKSPEKAAPKTESSDQQNAEEQPNLLISNRYLSRPLFGESTPPSATMLALQNMQLPPDNDPHTRSKEGGGIEHKPAQSNSFDFLSNQILSLTDIASNLQREMTQLSRRSKDNATDLVSLKAATNARDEDIRKSLRDLSSNLASKFLDGDAATRWDISALLGPENAINQLDEDSSPNSKKSYSVPRMQSPNPFIPPTDREFCASPGPMTDGSASIALLEKVLREMATKEGQENLQELVEELKSRPVSGESSKSGDSAMAEMLEEILNIVKEDSGSRTEGQDKLQEIVDELKARPAFDESRKAIDGGTTEMLEEILNIVRQDSGARAEGQDKLLELMEELKSRPVPDNSSKTANSAMAEMVEEILNIVKQESLTGALVRSVNPQEEFSDMDVARGNPEAGREIPLTDEMLDILKRVRNSVIEGGGMTNEVKALVRELRGEVLGMGRNIANKLEDAERTRAIEDTPKGPGSDEIAHIIDESLQELRDQLAAIMDNNREHFSALNEFRSAMDSAEIYSITKKALDEFGASREEPDGARMQKDDILEAVREAWETYKPEIELENFGLERDEILECLQEGLKAYQPQHEQAVTYDQVLAAVQAGLQESEQPPSITKDDVVQAVQEVMQQSEQPPSLTKEEVVQAVQECLENPEHRSSDGEQLAVIRDEILHAITENSQARSMDGEQLAAIRDEILHAVTESMTSQSALTRDSFDSGLGRDEILSAVSDGIEAHMVAAKESKSPGLTKEDVTSIVNDAFAAQQSAVSTDVQPSISREEILKAIEEGLESQNSMPREIELNKEDLMEAITSGLNEVTANTNHSLGEQFLEKLQQQLEGVKEEVRQRPIAAETDPEQVLNTIKDSITIVRQDIEGFASTASDESAKFEILDTVKEGFRLLQADLEKTITENAIATRAGGNPDTPELLDAMEKEFEHLRQTMSSLLIKSEPSTEKEEILEAIRDIAGNKQAAEGESVSDIIKREFESLRESMTMSLVPAEPVEQKSDKDDIVAAVHVALEAFHEEKGQTQGGIDKDEIIAAIQATLETHREESSHPKEDVGKDDIIAAIQATLETHREESQPKEAIGKDEIIAAIQATLETHREESSQPKEGIDKDEIITAIQATLEAHREEANQPKESFDKEEIIAAIQATLEAHREEANQPKEGADKDEIIAAIQATLETHRENIQPKEGVDKDDVLAAVQAALEAFHEEKGQAKDTSEKDEIITAIREISESQKGSSDETISKIVQEEFEKLRDSLTMSLVPADLKNDKDDVIAAVQAALESFHNEKGQAKEAEPADGEAKDGESLSTADLKDAFTDGVGLLKEDIAKLLERPAECNSTELLDTLKEGLSSLKAEVETLRQSHEESGNKDRELVLADESKQVNDIDGLKALISEIQVKVDAIEAAPRGAELPEDLLKKEHMDEVMAGLAELKDSVAGLMAREIPADEATAKKEDTDAIETLLRNTKSQLDEMVFPAPDEFARAEQLGSLEDMVKETKTVVTELQSRLEAECPTKAEIGTLETLLKDMWVALDESKSKGEEKEGEEDGEEAETDAEKLVKADLQTVEAMIFEVKTQVEELKLPDVETLPTKTDIQEITNLMNEFKEKVEADQELTGQGFDARKIEHAGLAEKIEEAKNVVEGLGDELKSKLDGSSEGLSELKGLLEGLAASSENFTTVENVNELTELINREFERARGEQDAAKLENEERDSAALVKQDEVKAAIVVELGTKIDEKLSEVMAKYDEAHSSIDTKFTEAAERGNEHLEAVTSTKSLAEDIKLVIGSMGDSVNEACEKMSADAKSFFEKVDTSYNKMEEMHNEVKTHHEQSRSDVERAAAATERVETQLHEFHPQVLESIQEILSIVGQHYNHAQESTRDLKQDLSVLPTSIPQMLALPPPETKYDDSQVHEKLNSLLESSKGDQVQEALNTLIERVTNDQVHEKLDQLLSKTSSTNGEVYEKLNELLDQATNNNGPIHDKLDTLIGHATNSEQSVNQMMKLDEMHKDIMETSRKMNEMLAAQSALVAEDTERRRKEAEEAAVALERRTAQREQIEAEIENLKDEKDSVLSMMQKLKTERDNLAAHNAKLNKEVSALETALELRHEEMQVMEDRADSLEKRILEGVLDHARTVLLSRPNSVQGLNMKKMRSTRGRNTSASSTASTAKDARSMLGSTIGLAMKKRNPAAPQANSSAAKERRILSLSHVTGNRGLADRQSSTPAGLMNLKRSQSVKSNSSYRKSSWGGRSSVANKENEAFPEEDENHSGDESDTGTERRTSYTGTYADSMTYGTGSVVSTNRQASMASTNLESVADEAEEDQRTERDENEAAPEGEDEAQQAEQEALDEEASKMVIYGQPADSGLGSEITSTAA